MKRYIVETLEMTQNFYVVEAESAQDAQDISQYAQDNWHNTLQTVFVDTSALDVDYLKYLQTPIHNLMVIKQMNQSEKFFSKFLFFQKRP